MNIPDSRYLGFFIDGCLEDKNITDDEKVILMKLGVRYGYKLTWFCGQDNSLIEGCRNVDDVCRKLGFNSNPNSIDLISNRIDISIRQLENYDYEYHVSKEVLINLIRWYSMSSPKLNTLGTILGKFSKGLMELSVHNKLPLRDIREIVDREYRLRYNESKKMSQEAPNP